MITLYGASIPFTARDIVGPGDAGDATQYVCDHCGWARTFVDRDFTGTLVMVALSFHADRCPKRPPAFFGIDFSSDYVKQRESDAISRGYSQAREDAARFIEERIGSEVWTLGELLKGIRAMEPTA